MSGVTIRFDGVIFREGDFDEGVEKFKDKLRDEAVRIAPRLTPVDTGFLKASWEKGSGVYIAYNDASYASFVDEGTRNMQGRFFSLKTAEQLSNIAPDILEEIIIQYYG